MKTMQVVDTEKAAYSKVEPPCPYFGRCGGCNLQDLAYTDQLAVKRRRLHRAVEALRLDTPLEIVPMEDPWRYRNKAELTFGHSDGRLLLGYHAARSFWRIVDLEDCLLLPEPAMRILRDVRDLAEQTGLPAYQPRTHQGFFRYALVRHSRATGQVLLGLITTPGSREVMEQMANTLRAAHPQLVSVYWGLTNRIADIALPEELHLLAGSAYLEDRMGPFTLRLHPLSFLQPASVQAERMYQRLCHAIERTAADVAWDLYCGLGVIALYLSQHARRVFGIDSEPHHLELAALNASLNRVPNVEFRLGRVETVLADRRFWLQEAKPDVVVVDPPRAGLHPKALASLLAARPRQIAYCSCNVQTLIRDLQSLVSSFPRYRIVEMTAFDMFPQTNHLETLTILERA